jgi:NADPH-dependent 2,4-dienoyl-CoA reductase/sulfur reductase-like enzyme
MAVGNRKRLVVVGAVAAGTSAAAKAGRTDPDLEIVLLERDPHISYGACGLPYFISGLIPSIEALIARTPTEFRKQGIDVRIRHEVLEIDVTQKRLRVADRENANDYTLPYDSLVVATGAESFRPPVPGLDLAGVFALRTLSDGLALQDALRHKPQGVVIVGGGYIGLEMAEAFRALGLPVTIVEMAPQLMVNLDQDMSASKAQGVCRKWSRNTARFQPTWCCYLSGYGPTPVWHSKLASRSERGRPLRWMNTCAPTSRASMRPATVRKPCIW